uniref:Uncharacterized protein n=1 Tax=Chromera velia CCMP2878 TaxID=1169474 RepID=A0A0G4I6T0_9ALVE|eukprot:Cvel_11416.t1-p1 / transcript=Cvel_11416.t1 / gene=Cvel_11416 / organism=Chromera_velia_CCMP2878 / gene_product=hypothetical protein / transcript_product=hypothetical protein / location=Cvel_scaffold717:41955-59895(-) / protein_length=2030 / sequence_SO=supercontig / SO=protein_coding / is_pseudo=false
MRAARRASQATVYGSPAEDARFNQLLTEIAANREGDPAEVASDVASVQLSEDEGGVKMRKNPVRDVCDELCYAYERCLKNRAMPFGGIDWKMYIRLLRAQKKLAATLDVQLRSRDHRTGSSLESAQQKQKPFLWRIIRIAFLLSTHPPSFRVLVAPVLADAENESLERRNILAKGIEHVRPAERLQCVPLCIFRTYLGSANTFDSMGGEGDKWDERKVSEEIVGHVEIFWLFQRYRLRQALMGRSVVAFAKAIKSGNKTEVPPASEVACLRAAVAALDNCYVNLERNIVTRVAEFLDSVGRPASQLIQLVEEMATLESGQQDAQRIYEALSAGAAFSDATAKRRRAQARAQTVAFEVSHIADLLALFESLRTGFADVLHLFGRRHLKLLHLKPHGGGDFSFSSLQLLKRHVNDKSWAIRRLARKAFRRLQALKDSTMKLRSLEKTDPNRLDLAVNSPFIKSLYKKVIRSSEMEPMALTILRVMSTWHSVKAEVDKLSSAEYETLKRQLTCPHRKENWAFLAAFKRRLLQEGNPPHFEWLCRVLFLDKRLSHRVWIHRKTKGERQGILGEAEWSLPSRKPSVWGGEKENPTTQQKTNGGTALTLPLNTTGRRTSCVSFAPSGLTPSATSVYAKRTQATLPPLTLPLNTPSRPPSELASPSPALAGGGATRSTLAPEEGERTQGTGARRQGLPQFPASTFSTFMQQQQQQTGANFKVGGGGGRDGNQQQQAVKGGGGGSPASYTQVRAKMRLQQIFRRIWQTIKDLPQDIDDTGWEVGMTPDEEQVESLFKMKGGDTSRKPARKSLRIAHGPGGIFSEDVTGTHQGGGGGGGAAGGSFLQNRTRRQSMSMSIRRRSSIAANAAVVAAAVPLDGATIRARAPKIAKIIDCFRFAKKRGSSASSLSSCTPGEGSDTECWTPRKKVAPLKQAESPSVLHAGGISKSRKMLGFGKEKRDVDNVKAVALKEERDREGGDLGNGGDGGGGGNGQDSGEKQAGKGKEGMEDAADRFNIKQKSLDEEVMLEDEMEMKRFVRRHVKGLENPKTPLEERLERLKTIEKEGTRPESEDEPQDGQWLGRVLRRSDVFRSLEGNEGGGFLRNMKGARGSTGAGRSNGRRVLSEQRGGLSMMVDADRIRALLAAEGAFGGPSFLDEDSSSSSHSSASSSPNSSSSSSSSSSSGSSQGSVFLPPSAEATSRRTRTARQTTQTASSNRSPARNPKSPELPLSRPTLRSRVSFHREKGEGGEDETGEDFEHPRTISQNEFTLEPARGSAEREREKQIVSSSDKSRERVASGGSKENSEQRASSSPKQIMYKTVAPILRQRPATQQDTAASGTKAQPLAFRPHGPLPRLPPSLRTSRTGRAEGSEGGLVPCTHRQTKTCTSHPRAPPSSSAASPPQSHIDSASAPPSQRSSPSRFTPSGNGRTKGTGRWISRGSQRTETATADGEESQHQTGSRAATGQAASRWSQNRSRHHACSIGEVKGRLSEWDIDCAEAEARLSAPSSISASPRGPSWTAALLMKRGDRIDPRRTARKPKKQHQLCKHVILNSTPSGRHNPSPNVTITGPVVCDPMQVDMIHRQPLEQQGELEGGVNQSGAPGGAGGSSFALHTLRTVFVEDLLQGLRKKERELASRGSNNEAGQPFQRECAETSSIHPETLQQQQQQQEKKEEGLLAPHQRGRAASGPPNLDSTDSPLLHSQRVGGSRVVAVSLTREKEGHVECGVGSPTVSLVMRSTKDDPGAEREGRSESEKGGGGEAEAEAEGVRERRKRRGQNRKPTKGREGAPLPLGLCTPRFCLDTDEVASDDSDRDPESSSAACKRHKRKHRSSHKKAHPCSSRDAVTLLGGVPSKPLREFMTRALSPNVNEAFPIFPQTDNSGVSRLVLPRVKVPSLWSSPSAAHLTQGVQKATSAGAIFRKGPKATKDVSRLGVRSDVKTNFGQGAVVVSHPLLRSVCSMPDLIGKAPPLPFHHDPHREGEMGTVSLSRKSTFAVSGKGLYYAEKWRLEEQVLLRHLPEALRPRGKVWDINEPEYT